MDKVGLIYILLFPNSKRYVGQTIRTIEERLIEHWCPSKREYGFPVNSAIRKYGKNNVSVECSFSIYGDQKDLDAAEDENILKYDTIGLNGYNLKRGGSHGAHSEETKIKISTAMRGRSHSEETKAKISVAKKGKSNGHEGMLVSEETKAKISLANKGKYRSEEWRARMSIAKKGKSHPHKGYIPSQETLAKRAATRKRNEPFKEKINAK